MVDIRKGHVVSDKPVEVEDAAGNAQRQRLEIKSIPATS